MNSTWDERMRLSTRFHGNVDYFLGGALLALALSGRAGITGPAAWPFVVAGAALILNALLTNFERGAFPIIHIPLHLWIDGVTGLLLAISPWILGFDRTAWIPHLVAGLVIVAAAFLSHTVPGYDRRRTAVEGPG